MGEVYRMEGDMSVCSDRDKEGKGCRHRAVESQDICSIRGFGEWLHLEGCVCMLGRK